MLCITVNGLLNQMDHQLAVIFFINFFLYVRLIFWFKEFNFCLKFFVKAITFLTDSIIVSTDLIVASMSFIVHYSLF